MAAGALVRLIPSKTYIGLGKLTCIQAGITEHAVMFPVDSIKVRILS